MDHTKYIELYCAIIQEFVNYAITLQNDISSDHVYIGWKTLNHVFNRITAKHPESIKKIYEISRNAYLIYLEYIDQMRSAIKVNSSDLSSALNSKNAVIFVYSKLSDDLKDIPNYDEHREWFYRAVMITDVVFSWTNKYLTIFDRRALITKHLSRALNAFIDSDHFPIIEKARRTIESNEIWKFREIDDFLGECISRKNKEEK